LDVKRNILMRNRSQIANDSFGIGDGGKTEIYSSVIVGLENSDIKANSRAGSGGSIRIETQAILGLQYRDRLTPESDITASSESGMNGSVQVNTLGVDPNAGLVELSETLSDESQKVAAGCASNQNSSFVMTGRGGVAQTPSDRTHPRLWSDLRLLSTTNQPTVAESTPLLVEATSLRRDRNGKVQLIAEQPARSSQLETCSKTASH
jgi:large exoprotein involved in heme utilization and adhesion